MSVKKKAKKKAKQLRLRGISGKIKPTPQELRIAQELVKPGAKKGAALIAAGVAPGNARSNSAEILGRPGVRAALAMTLEEAGVTTERLGQVMNEGLSATRVISANLLVIGKEKSDLPCENGIIDTTKEEPEIEKAFIRVEDFAVRHQYARTCFELLDLFPRTDAGPGGEERVTPSEEKNLIAQAEGEASKRNIARYQVKRDRQQI